jgi:hypothetical protein
MAVGDIRLEWRKSLGKLSGIIKANLDMKKICKIIGIPPIEG